MFVCIECSKSFSRRDSVLRHKKQQTHLIKTKNREEEKIISCDNDRLLTSIDENNYSSVEIIRDKVLALRGNQKPIQIQQPSKEENYFGNIHTKQRKDEEEERNENHEDGNSNSDFDDDDRSYVDGEDDIKCTEVNMLVDELPLLLSTGKTGKRVYEILRQLRINKVIK